MYTVNVQPDETALGILYFAKYDLKVLSILLEMYVLKRNRVLVCPHVASSFIQTASLISECVLAIVSISWDKYFPHHFDD